MTDIAPKAMIDGDGLPGGSWEKTTGKSTGPQKPEPTPKEGGESEKKDSQK